MPCASQSLWQLPQACSQTAFGQRRKTLRNALASLADDDALRTADIDPGARGETLSVADFVRLANQLAARQPTPRGVTSERPDA